MGSWQGTPLAKQTPFNASLPFFISVIISLICISGQDKIAGNRHGAGCWTIPWSHGLNHQHLTKPRALCEMNPDTAVQGAGQVWPRCCSISSECCQPLQEHSAHSQKQEQVCSPSSNSSSLSAESRGRTAAHLHWLSNLPCAFTCWLYSCSDRGIWLGFSDTSRTNWEETRRIKLESYWLSISLLQTGSWTLSYYPSTASSILLLMQTVYNTVQFLGTDLNWAVSWR